MKILIKNGRIFDGGGKEYVADVRIDGGTIVEIGQNLNYDLYPSIDAEKNYIIPGFIDMNCYICDPGYESREDIFTLSQSAAKGGFTTIACHPATNPVVDNKTVASYVMSKSRNYSNINMLLYGSMTKGCEGKEMAEIGEMLKAGVISVSDGGKCVFDTFLMRNIMIYSKMFNIPVITRCEDPVLSEGGVINGGKVSTVTGLKGIPREAEEIVAARNLILAGHTGARLHITEVSTKGTVELIRHAKMHGINVTCDTCPQYISLTENMVEGYNTFAKIDPPLRTEEDVMSVREGLSDGTIDAISSGHYPDTIESKMKEFDEASYGISSLETAYAVCYKYLVENKTMSYWEMIKKLTVNPAGILGIDLKGEISPGFDGDIVIIDKDFAYDVNPEEFASKAKYSPYKSEKVRGRILYTLVGGEVVYLS